MEKLLWCNTHQRRSYECTYKGGIAMPCVVVDLTDKLELIEERPDMTNLERARDVVGEIKTIDDERLVERITAALDEKDEEILGLQKALQKRTLAQLPPDLPR